MNWYIVAYIYWGVCAFMLFRQKGVAVALLVALFWPIVVGTAILNKII